MLGQLRHTSLPQKSDLELGGILDALDDQVNRCHHALTQGCVPDLEAHPSTDLGMTSFDAVGNADRPRVFLLAREEPLIRVARSSGPHPSTSLVRVLVSLATTFCAFGIVSTFATC